MTDLHLLNMKDWGSEATRKGFGRGLVQAGEQNDQVVALCADLTGSVQMELFAEKFPDRFVEVGVSIARLKRIKCVQHFTKLTLKLTT